MALITHPERLRSHHTGAGSPAGFNGAVRAAGGAIRRFADAFSESCHCIRAYNELAHLPPQALHEIASRRDELDRVIAGEAPRRARRKQSPES